MKFEEALKRYREGIAIRRSCWNKRTRLDPNPVSDDAPSCPGSIATYQLLAEDWEVAPEPDPWQPEEGSFYINSCGQIEKVNSPRPLRRGFGMERKTSSMASKAADAIQVHNRLLAYVHEHAPDWEPDWEDEEQVKSYIYKISGSSIKYGTSDTYTVFSVGTVHMPPEVAEQLVKDLESGRVVL